MQDYTEHEARKKMCPIRDGVSVNCVASSCMAWRWTENKHETKQDVVSAPEFGVGGKKIVNKDVFIPYKGICGMVKYN